MAAIVGNGGSPVSYARRTVVAYCHAVLEHRDPGRWRGTRRRFLAGSAAVLAARNVPVGRPTTPVPPAPAPPASTVASGPPSWVAPGVRITHHTATATIGSMSYELVEDPAGTWVDPTSGKRYREVFTSTPSPGGGTGSGEGLWTVDVVAVDGGDVVLSRTNYINDAFNGVYAPGSATGERVAASSVPTVWVHPTELAAMTSDTAGARLVLDGPVKIGETSYEARSVVDPSTTAYSFFAFEKASGVLLLSALRTSLGAGQPTQASTTELRGVRQRTTPGIGTAVPSWVSVGATLAYRGTQSFVNPMDPSSPAFTSNVVLDVKFSEVGSTWALYEGTIRNESVTEPASTIGAAGGIGPYWWDPQSLAAMQQGQVLDQDPLSGLTLTVGQPASGANGPAVPISATMSGISAESWFDTATGVLLAQTFAVESSGLTTRIELQQMP